MSSPAYIPWRDRAFVTVAEAATIIGRSPSCVRDCLCDGRLQGHRHRFGAPVLVSVPSLSALVDHMPPSPPQAFAAPRGAALRLVVDNA